MNITDDLEQLSRNQNEGKRGTANEREWTRIWEEDPAD